MSFTQEERATVEATGAVPMKIDGLECVVVRADLFKELRARMNDELTHDDLRAMLAASTDGSDWMSPEMDAYDQYDEHR